MALDSQDHADLRLRVADLTLRLEEAQELLVAIRTGSVDALVVKTADQEQVYTLWAADQVHRVVLESMSEGAITVAADGTILYANKRFAELIGRPLARVVGRAFAELTYDKDRAQWAELLRRGSQRPCTRELLLVGRADARILCRLSLSPLSAGDGVSTCVIVVTDVTELRRTQAALEDAKAKLEVRVKRRTAELRAQKEWFQVTLSSIADAVIVASPDGKVVFTNAVADALTGWENGNGIGQPLHEVLHLINGRTREPLDDPGATLLASGGAQGLAEPTVLVARDQREHPVEVSAAPVRGEQGHALGLVLVFRDISERQQACLQTQRHLEELEEANEAKDLFFNALSHELRTPLAAMLTSVEVLKHPAAEEGQRDGALGVLERSVRHQARLIDDLLDLSRIVRGTVTLSTEPLDLREVVAAQWGSAEPEAAKAGLSLRVQAPDEPVLVAGDRLRLGQVIANLLSNATKFTERGGSILVQTSIEQDVAVVRVSDTGVGISAELMTHLCEPFRQGQTSLARTKGGLGIGLAVSRSMAELHGGTLEARSAGIGQGSELALRIPLAAPGAASEPVAKTPAAEPPRRHVLVVEDNADLRDTLVTLLKLMGHTITAADCGRRAVEIVGREQLDMALIDIGLPDIDGYEVARQIRANPATKDLMLVALSGYATADHRERALEAGFDVHLAKPVDPGEILKLLVDLHAGRLEELC